MPNEAHRATHYVLPGDTRRSCSVMAAAAVKLAG